MKYDGFISFLEEKNYSETTIASYELVLNQFFSFLRQLYKKKIELYEIKSKDIRDYLSTQGDNQKAISTINKELAILKSYFDYLWERNKVPIDPAAKIKRLKVQKHLDISLFYEDLLKVKELVIANTNYTAKRKALFILAMEGLKASEFKFKKDDVSIIDDRIKINLSNRVITLDNIDASIFLEFYYNNLLNQSEYLFTYTDSVNNRIIPITFMGIHYHLKNIQKDYDINQDLQLTTIRKALCYYLYINKKLAVQRIALIMGIEEQTVSIYLSKLTKSMKSI